MSSILKALKKLEEEQSGRAAGGGEGGRFVGVESPARHAWLPLACGVGIGLLLSGAVFYWAFVSSPEPVAAPAPAVSAPPVAAAPQAAPRQDELPSAPARPTPPPVTPMPTRPLPTPPPAATRSGPAAVIPARSAPAVVEQVAVERSDIPEAGRQWSAPHLAVSEILAAAGAEPMAVVNGLPVMAGTVVDGALVKEIRPDRVIFVIDGKTVAVPPAP